MPVRWSRTDGASLPVRWSRTDGASLPVRWSRAVFEAEVPDVFPVRSIFVIQSSCGSRRGGTMGRRNEHNAGVAFAIGGGDQIAYRLAAILTNRCRAAWITRLGLIRRNCSGILFRTTRSRPSNGNEMPVAHTLRQSRPSVVISCEGAAVNPARSAGTGCVRPRAEPPITPSIREVSTLDQEVGLRRRSMRRIMARLTKAATLRA